MKFPIIEIILIQRQTYNRHVVATYLEISTLVKMTNQSLGINSKVLVNLNLLLESGWIEGDYEAPSILLAYEPTFNTWYFVVDDTKSIIELSDEEGTTYIVNSDDCHVESGVYVCHDVQVIHELPITDRQYYVNESLVPLLDDEYLLE